MSAEVEAILHAALSLPAESRAALAEKLLESLVRADQREIVDEWAKEAESRIRICRRSSTSNSRERSSPISANWVVAATKNSVLKCGIPRPFDCEPRKSAL